MNQLIFSISNTQCLKRLSWSIPAMYVRRITNQPLPATKQPRLAYNTLADAFRATTDRVREEKSLSPEKKIEIETDLSEDELEKLLHFKKKEKASKLAVIVVVLCCVGVSYELLKWPIEKKAYLYDRYGRRIDPDTGVYVPRLL